MKSFLVNDDCIKRRKNDALLMVSETTVLLKITASINARIIDSEEVGIIDASQCANVKV